MLIRAAIVAQSGALDRPGRRGRRLVMRLAERRREPDEAHFTEGEPDLEAPEEFAIAELDEEMILEEELDNEDVLEQDVDEDTLEVTLEDLVHSDDGEDDGDDVVAGPLGAEDVEESLDLILFERMALVDPDADGPDGPGVVPPPTTDNVDLVEVAPCGSDEFVCRSCFLVLRRVQLVDAGAMRCRDCSA
jgi:hypothetical protein